MPTKTKKPSTKSKSTKKSPSKLDRVIKKLNLARPRNQFIVAFLVVGVLGGGYFAYQSFASTTVISSMTLCQNEQCGYAKDAAKNNKTVTVLWNGKNRGFARTSSAGWLSGGYYNVCAAVKTGGGVVNLGLRNRQTGANIGTLSAAVSGTGNTYVRACTGQSIWVPNYQNVEATVEYATTGASQSTVNAINVGLVTVEVGSRASNPDVKPAK